MSDEQKEPITARFWVTKTKFTIFATFKTGRVTLSWPRTEEGTEITDAKTLAVNLIDLIKDCVDEVTVVDAAKGLDKELDELLGRKDDGDE